MRAVGPSVGVVPLVILVGRRYLEHPPRCNGRQIVTLLDTVCRDRPGAPGWCDGPLPLLIMTVVQAT